MALAGTWTPLPDEITYLWLRDGASIPGATGSSLELTAADVNHRISVITTANKSGYTSVAKTSAATARVLP